MAKTTIVIDLRDGLRQPLRAGRILVHHQYTLNGVLITPPPKEGTEGPFEFTVEAADGKLGSQTIVASATGFEQEGLIFPTRLAAGNCCKFRLMLTPKRPSAEFGSQSELIAKLKGATREKWAELLEPLKTTVLQDGSMDRQLACLFNILTGMEDIDRRWKTSLIKSIRRIPKLESEATTWQKFEGLRADRAFLELDRAAVGKVKDKEFEFHNGGAFEKDPVVDSSHAPADHSFRQTETGFPITPMQICLITESKALKKLNAPEGTILADVDFDEFPNGIEHGFLEVLPHSLTGGKTDPYVIYRRRWTLHEALCAARPEKFNGDPGQFDPPYGLSAG